MQYKNKYRLRLADGRSEPIPGLEGASRIILIDEEQVGAQDITFGYSKYKPKSSLHKKHTHPQAEEIMYILAGRGIGGVIDEELELRPGDTLWVPRGAVHWFYNPFDEVCEFLFLYTRSNLQKAGLQQVSRKE
ncbi:MAG: cupin domain-containing protein [Syntrophaceae bacterium]|jgi:quercetin dioxygenase-like cupin family protein|nr:cupin domain-containing protein [Syntrophaceae bacterium]